MIPRKRVPFRFASVLALGAAFVGVGLFAVVSFSVFKEKPAATTTVAPLASELPVSEWPTIKVPKDGVSDNISAPLYLHLVVPGRGFEIHEVFGAGGECVVNSSVNPCPPAEVDVYIDHYYFKDTSHMTQYVSYAYAKKN